MLKTKVVKNLVVLNLFVLVEIITFRNFCPRSKTAVARLYQNDQNVRSAFTHKNNKNTILIYHEISPRQFIHFILILIKITSWEKRYVENVQSSLITILQISNKLLGKGIKKVYWHMGGLLLYLLYCSQGMLLLFWYLHV